ncbi:hypothetical protein [Dipodfec virus UOA04_Rod_680]|nr:hypothetical protein [Dipodfec virus UOA04_Rod_680]
MTSELTKTPLVEDSKNSFDIGVYSIYDSVLKQFDAPISIPQSKLYDYMNLLVNDVQSKFYGHESDYILNKIGDFNSETGEIELHFIERVSLLDSYIDVNKRRLQTILQVLNYLPTGYYKMPVEQKQVIQERIDNAISEYVAQYVIPDLDVSQFDTNKIRDIYNNYDSYVKTS